MPLTFFPRLQKWRENTDDQLTARLRCLSASRSVIGWDIWADYVINSGVYFCFQTSSHVCDRKRQRLQLSVNISTRRALKRAWQKGISDQNSNSITIYAWNDRQGAIIMAAHGKQIQRCTNALLKYFGAIQLWREEKELFLWAIIMS